MNDFWSGGRVFGRPLWQIVLVAWLISLASLLASRNWLDAIGTGAIGAVVTYTLFRRSRRPAEEPSLASSVLFFTTFAAVELLRLFAGLDDGASTWSLVIDGALAVVFIYMLIWSLAHRRRARAG